MYGKMNTTKVAHQSEKRRFWLKINAPGYVANETVKGPVKVHLIKKQPKTKHLGQKLLKAPPKQVKTHEKTSNSAVTDEIITKQTQRDTPTTTTTETTNYPKEVRRGDELKGPTGIPTRKTSKVLQETKINHYFQAKKVLSTSGITYPKKLSEENRTTQTFSGRSLKIPLQPKDKTPQGTKNSVPTITIPKQLQTEPFQALTHGGTRSTIPTTKSHQNSIPSTPKTTNELSIKIAPKTLAKPSKESDTKVPKTKTNTPLKEYPTRDTTATRYIQHTTNTTNTIVRNTGIPPTYTSNYYLPLTDSFNRKMASHVNNALNAIENSKLSLQQVLQNQRTPAKVGQTTDSSTNECIAPPTPPNDGSWTKVKTTKTDSKKKGHERAIFPSNFPTQEHIPPLENENRPAVKTIGVTITIKLPNSHEVSHSRFLQAMLACIHMVDKWASFLPTDTIHNKTGTDTSAHLATTKAINTKGTDLDKYMEEPIRRYGSSEFAVRIAVSTLISLQDILEQEPVQTYFRQERIRMEENQLTAAHPTNVGFLLFAVPKQEALPVYHARLKKALGEHSPEFYLTISAVFPERPRGTKEAKLNPQKYI